MSRFSHFNIGIMLCICATICSIFGYFVFLAYAAGKDGSGGSIFDGSFILIFLIFGGLILGSLWAAFANFRRGLRHSKPETGTVKTQPVASSRPPAPTTADEKLAHLVPKRKDDHAD